MPDFNVRSDSVDVEQVMEQIRARIREKRGVDYTEEQIRELAAVKLEKFLDPRGVRSDLLAEFRKLQTAPAPYSVPLYPFDDSTLFDSHRGIVRFFRRLFKPVLKLVFNANALSHSLRQQVEINRQAVERFDRLETNAPLYYELLHNLVLELTRATIEVKNMKMRVESLASRLEFNERRARALESAVVYRTEESAERSAAPPATVRSDRRSEGRPDARPEGRPDFSRPDAFVPAAPGLPSAETPSAQVGGGGSTPPVPGEGPGQRSRRRRRRRGRRGGASAVSTMGGGENTAGQPHGDASASPLGEPEDARDTRPESFESALGSSSHPAEPQAGAPSEPTTPVAEPPHAPDTPDADQ